MLNKSSVAPIATANTISTWSSAEPELLDEEGVATVDEFVALVPDEVLVALVLETKNQSAAMGLPRCVSSTNFVRLNPTRLNTDAVKFAKIGTKSGGTVKSAGSS